MPTDTAIIVAVVVLIFVIFAGALAWASFYSRGVRVPGATYFNTSKADK